MRKVELTEEDLTILSAYTGYMLIDKFDLIHKLFEDVLDEPIFTHQFVYPPFMNMLKEKVKPKYDKVIEKLVAQLKVEEE